mmetsp:Transcript_136690/g.237330  ORF Transcript_136690/g.237330 Transcript_136690/m.237330 type:complete len:725 (-) Transcript_136690:215-2389(-)
MQRFLLLLWLVAIGADVEYIDQPFPPWVDPSAPGHEYRSHHYAYRAFRGVPLANSSSMPPNMKVVYVADMGLDEHNSVVHQVLQAIKDEKPDMVLHSGDLDYRGNPVKWEKQLVDYFGEDFPYFYTPGDHERTEWHQSSRHGVGYQKHLAARIKRTGIQCAGEVGIHMVCSHKGLVFLMSGSGTFDLPAQHWEEGDAQLQRVFEQGAQWVVCSWHRSPGHLQLWHAEERHPSDQFEVCRRIGAMVVSGHAHLYSRTHMMSNYSCPSVASFDNPLELSPGRSFHVVAGTGGAELHSFVEQYQNVYSEVWKTPPKGKPYRRVDAKTNLQKVPPYFAKAVGLDMGLRSGYLVCTYNVDGHLHKAVCNFKDVYGHVYETFHIVNPKRSPSLQTNVSTAPNASSGGDPPMAPAAPVQGKVWCEEPLLVASRVVAECHASLTPPVLPSRLRFQVDADAVAQVRMRPPYSPDWGQRYTFAVEALTRPLKACISICIVDGGNCKGLGDPLTIQFPALRARHARQRWWRVVMDAVGIFPRPNYGSPAVAYLLGTELIHQLERKGAWLRHALGWSPITDTRFLRSHPSLMDVTDDEAYQPRLALQEQVGLGVTNVTVLRAVRMLEIRGRAHHKAPVAGHFNNGDVFPTRSRTLEWLEIPQGWVRLGSGIIEEFLPETSLMSQAKPFLPYETYRLQYASDDEHQCLLPLFMQVSTDTNSTSWVPKNNKKKKGKKK